MTGMVCSLQRDLKNLRRPLLASEASGQHHSSRRITCCLESAQAANKSSSKGLLGVPVVVQQIKNPTNIHADPSSIPGLAQLVKDPVLL